MKICTTCKIEKSVSLFPALKRNQDGLDTRCKVCKNLYQSAWRDKNRDKTRASMNAFYVRNRDKILLRHKFLRDSDKEKDALRKKIYLRKVRLDVLTHYSGGSPRCACCGENMIEFLSLDHIYGNGSAHRRELKHRGTFTYLWARTNNYPAIFQVLCMNCNFAKGKYGYCPHQRRNQNAYSV